MLNIILLGLNHKTAPVELRECIAFSDDNTCTALETLHDIPDIKEAMLFSTCNRVEVLIVTESPLDGIEAVKKFISQFNGVPLSVFEKSLYILEGNDAVHHLFRVASSLDSMIVGEPQVLGQIKEAYKLAAFQKTTGIILNRLLSRAFSVAKRIRSETEIGDGAVSVSFAAIELARKIFKTLEGKKVLLIGAGEMAEIAVQNLQKNRLGDIYVANRTFERAVSLARQFNGNPICLEEITDCLKQIDVVISSTESPDFIITRTQVKNIMRSRRNRPIFFIDIAVPRDIDPGINQLPNVYVYNIDDLKNIIEDNLEGRKREAIKGERIVDEAVISFNGWYKSLDIAPTLMALRKKVDTIAKKEVEKTLKSLNHLSAKDCDAINKMLKSLTNKILHDPTLFLKSNGFGDDKVLAINITRKLFNLDE